MRTNQNKTFATKHGDVEITVNQLPAMQAGHLLMRLGKSLGPALAGMAGAVDHGKAEGGLGLNDAALSPAVGEFFAKFDGAELEHLTRELLKSAQARVNGEFVPVLDGFNVMFQGHLPSWFKLLWFALGVNYGNFFDALGGFGGLSQYLPRKAATPSPKTPDSPVSSGLRNG